MAANPKVTRFAPQIIQAFRETATYSEAELSQWVAATMALMHRESRGNPTATHKKTKAYGLFQTLPKYHPILHDPQAQIRYFAKAMARYHRPTQGHIPSGLMVWASGPGALRKFVETGEAAHNKVVPHLRNVQDMTAGKGWRDYSGWLTGWTQKGSPTTNAFVGSRRYKLAAQVTPGPPLASPWDGRVLWYSKSRKVGTRGPGGISSLQLDKVGGSQFLPFALLGMVIFAFFTFWGSGK